MKIKKKHECHKKNEIWNNKKFLSIDQSELPNQTAKQLMICRKLKIKKNKKKNKLK